MALLRFTGVPTLPETLRPIFRQLWRWRWGVLLALGALGLLAWGARAVGAKEAMDEVVGRLRDAGAPVFFTAMALLPAVGFPLLPFAVAAGPVFAPQLGTGGVIACAICAVTVNVALSYALASSLLRAPVVRLMQRLGYRLPDPRGGNAWFFVALVRLAPGLPFWAQSYLLGLMRVRFGVYMAVSTLIPASYLAGTIAFGDAMMQGNRRAAAAAVAALVVVGAGLYLLRRRMAAAATRAAAAPPPR